MSEPKLQVSPQHFSINSNDSDDKALVTVTNTGSMPVALRLLTTDREYFSVSPREGVLQPGESQSTVILYTGRKVVKTKAGAKHLTEASFKLEYRSVSASDESNLAAASTTISELLKSVDKKAKRSVILTCAISQSSKAGSSASLKKLVEGESQGSNVYESATQVLLDGGNEEGPKAASQQPQTKEHSTKVHSVAKPNPAVSNDTAASSTSAGILAKPAVMATAATAVAVVVIGIIYSARRK